MKTLFEQLLQTLHVPFTRSYTREAYLQHPDRNNLWGINRLLNAYGVENVSILLDDKEKLSQLEPPFLAEFSQDLAIVQEVSSDGVQLIWHHERINVPAAQFKESWSGVVTLLRKGNRAQEPFYERHRRQEIRKWITRSLLLILPLSALAVGWCTQVSHYYWPDIALLLLNTCGAVVSWLLLRQSAHIDNGTIDKVCSLFTKGNCHQVLDSDEASVWGFHWSEIGFCFFLTNLAVACWLPSIYTFWMPWAFAASLPFTLWSFWTQAFKLKAWCMLCMTVLAILWTGTLLCMCTGAFSTCFSLTDGWKLASAYAGLGVFTLLATHSVLDLWKRNRHITQLRYQLNRFRSDAAIFEAKLNEAPLHELATDVRPIVLAEGETGKPTITVVSNPFCQPCSLLHQRLNALRNDGFRIQYVLTSFNQSLFTANEKIAAYAEQLSPESMWQFLDEWFTIGRKRPKEYWNRKPITVTGKARLRAEAQFNWCREQQLYTTPTILVNQRLLPDLYEVEDIRIIYSA